MSLVLPSVLKADPVEIKGFNVICIGDSTVLSVDVSPGFSPSRYYWSTGDRTPSITVRPNVQTPYTVEVYDGAGDLIGSAQQTVFVTIKPTSRPIHDSICLGNEATLGVTTTAPYIFWSTGGTTDSINIYPRADSTCTVQVSNYPIVDVGYSNNCYRQDSATVIVGEEARFYIQGDTVGCIGSTVTLTLVDGFDILWSTSETTTTITPEIYDGSDIVFQVSATDNVGCEGTKSITVHGTDAPDVAVLAENDQDTICKGESVLLTASGAVHYEWNMFVTTDTIRVSPKETFTYTVTGYADPSLTHCSTTKSITIAVENCDLIYFPTAISLSSQTPENRIFRPLGVPNSFSSYYLAILSRWGQLIFESDSFEIGWNGTHQGENVRPGAYVYKFRLTNKGDVWEKIGTVTVVD